MSVLFRATTTTGNKSSTTEARIHQMFSLLRKISLLPVLTIALWKLSKAAVLSTIVMTKVIPTTQAGSWPSSRKKDMLPSCGGSPGHAPDHAASSPVTPTKVRMTVTATVAILVPIFKSRSVRDAKVRSQKP